MPRTRICTVVDVPADRLWKTLSAYGTWYTWLERVSESNIEGHDTAIVPVGAVRAVGPRGNPRVRERLVASDDATRTISYEVADEPKWSAPIRHYRATARIIALTEAPGSVIEWSGQYDCDLADEPAMEAMLAGLYRSFIGWLADASR